MNLAQLATEIHASNVAAGWWTDLKTRESILATRNRPEMLMLAVSEIAEAAEGLDGRPDDKLPHLPMHDVELGDFVIRQLDQIGAEMSLGHAPPYCFEDMGPTLEMAAKDLAPLRDSDRLMAIVCLVSEAMEHLRKGRMRGYIETMCSGIELAFGIAQLRQVDLLDIIAQKRAFNAVRADHQVENRVQDGGKAF